MWQTSLVFISLCALAVVTVILKKLDAKAAATAVIIGFITWLGEGYGGIALLSTFFITGTIATSWRVRTKQQTGLAEERRGQRSASQVVANGGVTAIISLASFLIPEHRVLTLLMVASSLSSATADTVSSELGNVYGKKFYKITNLKRDLRGLDGVISLEGTLVGVAGSGLIALIFLFFAGCSFHFLWIVIAGITGNLTDSVLGATLERNKILSNDTVNFINTLTGALVALLLHVTFG